MWPERMKKELIENLTKDRKQMTNVSAKNMIAWMDDSFIVYASDSKIKKTIGVNLLGVYRVLHKEALVMETAMMNAAITKYNEIT